MSAAPSSADLSWETAMRLLEGLPALPLAERGAQVELLVRHASPGIRERVLRLGANLLPEERMTEHLRNEQDAVLRNAGLEMLKLRGARSVPLAVRLLADPEPDVVLQAVLLLDHLRDPRALEALRAVLGHTDLNVVQAAILAVGRLGDARSIPDLLPFLDADPWLQMAAVQALGDLRSRRAVGALARLLGDPVSGGLAAEALARIGGRGACRALAGQWLGRTGPLDDAALLGLLAHVLEGLPRAHGGPAAADRLLASARERLGDPAAEVRAAAARCVLALGPGPGDEGALAVLVGLAADEGAGAGAGAEGTGGGGGGGGGAYAGSEGRAGGAGAGGGAGGGSGVEEASPSAALRRRPDLAGALLRRPGIARAWGLQLAALFPRRVAPGDVLAALGDAGRSPETLAAAVRFLVRLRPPAGTDRAGAPRAGSGAAAAPGRGRGLPARAPAELGAAVLELYLGLPAERRPELAPVLRRFRAALRGALAGRGEASELGAADRVVLEALLGVPPREVAAALVRLPLPRRLAAVVQLAAHRPVMRALPWTSWLSDDLEAYAVAAAEAAAGSRLGELLPPLRALPPRLAEPPLLRAFAELADREAVPWLLAVERLRPELRPLALECLGRIGGAAARRALGEAAAGGRSTDARVAYRALSLCATAEDAALFRAAVGHPDWYVRLACAEALGRIGGPEDQAPLARLAADPVPAVAHRALSSLEG